MTRIVWTLTPSGFNREIDVIIEVSSGVSVDSIDIYSTIDDIEVFGWRITKWLSSSNKSRQLDAPLGSFDLQYAGDGFSMCASKVDDDMCEITIRYLSGEDKKKIPSRILGPLAVPLAKVAEFVGELNEAIGVTEQRTITLV